MQRCRHDIILKLPNSHVDLQKIQDLRVSGLKTVTDHGAFRLAVWSEEEPTINVVQTADRHGGEEAPRTQEAISEGLDLKSRPKIWGRPSICPTTREAILRQLVQSRSYLMPTADRKGTSRGQSSPQTLWRGSLWESRRENGR